MKNVVVFVLGAVAGFATAVFVSSSPRGSRFLDEIGERASGFADAVVDGYRAREAELKSTIAEAQEAIVGAATDDDGSAK